jgi:hypothetical protein
MVEGGLFQGRLLFCPLDIFRSTKPIDLLNQWRTELGN